MSVFAIAFSLETFSVLSTGHATAGQFGRATLLMRYVAAIVVRVAIKERISSGVGVGILSGFVVIVHVVCWAKVSFRVVCAEGGRRRRTRCAGVAFDAPAGSV